MAMNTLTARLAADVRAAFPELVDTMGDRVYSVVRRMVPNAADAEDVTAETFLRAYRALAEMEAGRIRAMRLEGWVWTIALNLTRNSARRRSRKPTVPLDPAWVAAAGGPGPEAEVVGDSLVAELLAELPPPQRAAVALRHIAGLPYAEIAAITGRPEGSVKSDVHRGLERLREHLEVAA